ncbi:MAG: SUMF1/EgtB/PvdO family nonheme iron enzyme [Oceanospirillaceae bacterium]|nr:SUMF1/EgtB/PvdO family nonheme iron enzyme [Oceanospirillaceae bacterium]
MRVFTYALALSLILSPLAAASNRIALVVGNDDYTTLPNLNNARKDAEDMSAKLEQFGFDVITKLDVKQRDLYRTLYDFSGKLKAGDTALVFYAGHGISSQGENYLIPSDAIVEYETDLRAEAITASEVMASMSDSGAGLSILILDACRDNPLPKRRRSAARGLSVVSTQQSTAGSVILYSAAPGQTAEDGGAGQNGVFTGALLKNLDTAGLSIDQVFKRTAQDVASLTAKRQQPWISNSFTGDFYFNDNPVVVTPKQPEPEIKKYDKELELAFWSSVAESKNHKLFEAYLKQYPEGSFAELARVKIEVLKMQAVPESAPTTVREAASTNAGNLEPVSPEELAFWDGLKGSEDLNKYRTYLGKFSNPRFKKQAEQAIARLEQRELGFWDSVKGSQKAELYQLYIKKYPDGKFVKEAEQLFAKLSKPVPTLAPKPDVDLVALNVAVTPSDAQIRVLNIVPKFKQGMALKAGRYNIEISKPGYEKRVQWYELSKPSEQLVVTLSRIPPQKKSVSGDTQPVSKQEQQFWNSIAKSSNPEVFDSYIKYYPEGAYLNIAKARYAELTGTKTQVQPVQVKTIPFRVEVQPRDARVRIMNIVPKFSQGIMLDPGRYYVEVSRKGYETVNIPFYLSSSSSILKINLKEVSVGSVKQVENQSGQRPSQLITSAKEQQYWSTMRESDNQTINYNEDRDKAFWNSIRSSKNPDVFESYLKKYPTGKFAREAKSALARLSKESSKFHAPSMIRIKAGSFKMGAGGKGLWQKPAHRVKVEAFEIGKYEVTQKEWQACFNAGGCKRIPTSMSANSVPDAPVSGVNWTEVKRQFIPWLNRMTGSQYRLPTEAEWEYVVRAGTTTKHFYGNSAKSLTGKIHAGGQSRPAKVGSYSASRWGVYDMLGNVEEWVEDCWHKDYKGAPSSSIAWIKDGDCSKRVVRGDAYSGYLTQVESAKRSALGSDSNAFDLGFRLARSLK